jgi:hypothetical protein
MPAASSQLPRHGWRSSGSEKALQQQAVVESGSDEDLVRRCRIDRRAREVLGDLQRADEARKVTLLRRPASGRPARHG